MRSSPTPKYGIYINSVAIAIATRHGSFRRNRRIFHNAFRLAFEPPDFPRAIITTQIEPANAAIAAAANFSSKEHEGSYLDDGSCRFLRLRDREVSPISRDRRRRFFDAEEERERSRISISRISFSASPSASSRRELTGAFCAWHPLNDAYVPLLFPL